MTNLKNNQDHVVLVTPKGKILGTEEKIKAHEKGVLHLAFSIFIFNDKGEMLLQQRAFSKYHFKGIWSNACCGHPRPEEDMAAAAHRRLEEELRFSTPLRMVHPFIYRAEDPQSGLIEHELDSIFVGIYNEQEIDFDPEEIQAVRWIDLPTLYLELSAEADKFSYWFKVALRELEKWHLLSPSDLRGWLKR